MVATTFQKQLKAGFHPLSSKSATQPTIARYCRGLLTLGLTTGLFAIATAASAQSIKQPVAQGSGQYIACPADPQGLMCPSEESQEQSAPVTSASPSAVNAPAGAFHGLSTAQMEQISSLLLGFLYFVLPVGFGLSIFLHDRYQAYRTAALEAQIKLLERLWEQSPQA